MNINLSAYAQKQLFISATERAQDIMLYAYDEDESSKDLFEKEIKSIITLEDFNCVVALRALYKSSLSQTSLKKVPQWAKEILVKYNIITDVSMSLL